MYTDVVDAAEGRRGDKRAPDSDEQESRVERRKGRRAGTVVANRRQHVRCMYQRTPSAFSRVGVGVTRASFGLSCVVSERDCKEAAGCSGRGAEDAPCECSRCK